LEGYTKKVLITIRRRNKDWGLVMGEGEGEGTGEGAVNPAPYL